MAALTCIFRYIKPGYGPQPPHLIHAGLVLVLLPLRLQFCARDAARSNDHVQMANDYHVLHVKPADCVTFPVRGRRVNAFAATPKWEYFFSHLVLSTQTNLIKIETIQPADRGPVSWHLRGLSAPRLPPRLKWVPVIHPSSLSGCLIYASSAAHAPLRWPVRVHLPAADNYADNWLDKTRLIFRGDGEGFGYTPFGVNSDAEINPERWRAGAPEPLQILVWFPPAETGETRWCMGQEEPSMNI